jgi:hypothetical protein
MPSYLIFEVGWLSRQIQKKKMLVFDFTSSKSTSLNFSDGETESWKGDMVFPQLDSC